jgi:hypothetical protein
MCQNADDDTWQLHSTAYDVIEVASVIMPDGATWLGTQDHSKWVRRVQYARIFAAVLIRLLLDCRYPPFKVPQYAWVTSIGCALR